MPAFAQEMSPALFQKLSLSDSHDNDSLENTQTAESTEGFGNTASFEGSRERPFISFVNLEHPELTRDFDVQFVQGMKRHGWKRPAFHIRKYIVNMDMDLWSATIPGDNDYPAEYKDRCILIKRPSFDCIQRHPALYHEKMDCAETKEAHEGYLLKNEIVEYVYHLLVFPVSVALDNNHIAGEATLIVETKYNAVVVPDSHDTNPFKKKLCMVWVYWEIALKQGGIKLGAKEKKTTSKATMFG